MLVKLMIVTLICLSFLFTFKYSEASDFLNIYCGNVRKGKCLSLILKDEVFEKKWEHGNAGPGTLNRNGYLNIPVNVVDLDKLRSYLEGASLAKNKLHKMPVKTEALEGPQSGTTVTKEEPDKEEPKRARDNEYYSLMLLQGYSSFETSVASLDSNYWKTVTNIQLNAYNILPSFHMGLNLAKGVTTSLGDRGLYMSYDLMRKRDSDAYIGVRYLYLQTFIDETVANDLGIEITESYFLGGGSVQRIGDFSLFRELSFNLFCYYSVLTNYSGQTENLTVNGGYLLGSGLKAEIWENIKVYLELTQFNLSGDIELTANSINFGVEFSI